MKKITKTLFVLFFSLLLCIPFNNLEAKTLREMKEELASTKANLANIEAKRKEAQNKINSSQTEMNKAAAEIEQFEAEINAAREKIYELEIEIEEKKVEIADLLRFFQISNGENAYLEYIFGAKDFADLIYRSTIVEQLTDYNDKLIEEMNTMIEENKRLQIELEEKIKVNEIAIANFKEQLKTLNLTLDDLDEHQKDYNAEIKATEAEIEYYENFGCNLDEEISACIDVPYANGFTRPTTYGYISSNYGYRYIWGKTSFHNGIDIALSEGNNVYASAAGYVAKKVYKASCGGNMVYIQHNIDGVKYTTVYMHLQSFNVNVGDIVTINTIIAKSGGGATTMTYDSCTTGAHLHFGVLKGWTTSSSYSTDPRNYINFPAKYSSYNSRW